MLLGPLKLLAPALIPSWNFFDVIAPSPRVEYALLPTRGHVADDWREFRPKPTHAPIGTMLARLVWNPRWNQTLFVTSCAERLAEDRTPQHSEDELFKRIAADLKREPLDEDRPWLCFRLVFVSRGDAGVEQEVLFQPYPRLLADIVTR